MVVGLFYQILYRVSLMIWERPTTDFGGGPFFALVFQYKSIYIEKPMQKTAHHQIGGGPFIKLSRFEKFYFDGGGPFLADFI